MRRALESLVVFLVVALAACDGGAKGSAVPALPDFAAHAPHTASFATLYAFEANPGGGGPSALAILNGTLYGVTHSGGGAKWCGSGCGTVYSVTPAGAFDSFFAFQVDGHQGRPTTALTPWNGWMYGGAWANDAAFPKSMVYRIDASGKEQIVARLPDRENTAGALTIVNGTIYGASNRGGRFERGLIFAIGSDGSVRTVYSFKGGEDTSRPSGIVAHNGVLYGVGTGQYTKCKCASIFAVTPSGQERIVYRFSPGERNGEKPITPLAFDAAGNLYGAMAPLGSYGICSGPSRACGAIFEIANGGTPRFRVLYQFKGGKDGSTPNGGLVVDSAGRIFGTTAWGGNVSSGSGRLGFGTIYALTPSGTTHVKTILHAFTGTDGADPTFQMVKLGNALYGTTNFGGNAQACPYSYGGPQYVAGCGTIYKIVP